MNFSFETHAYNKFLNRVGIRGDSIKVKISKILIPFTICWLPLALFTLINNTFWTGDISNSFITTFDTQARLLIAMPVFILAEKEVSARLGLILTQFLNSGIIRKEDHVSFVEMIERKVQFLSSNWTDLAVYVICYIHVFFVMFYASENTSLLTWQINVEDGETILSLAGKWSSFISRPFVLFLFYRWLLRIIVWGIMMKKISSFNLNLFAVHPDLAGGLGFLGYAFRYFSPITFAISAVVAGNMADFILIEELHLSDVKIIILVYFVIVTLLFVLPLLSFSVKLLNACEESVFENNDFANGIFRELRIKLLKDYDHVNAEDLKTPVFSTATDLSSVIDNGQKMKLLPFNLKDLIPLWSMTALPFLAVVLMEIPLSELLKSLVSILA